MAQASGRNRRVAVVMACAKTTTATWPGRGQSGCRLRCRRRCHRPALPLPGGIAGRFVISEDLGVRDVGSQVRAGEGQALSGGSGMRAGAAQESTGRQLARQRRQRGRLPSDGSRAVRRGPSRAGQSGAMHGVRKEFHRVGSQVPIRGEIQLNRSKAGPRRRARTPGRESRPRRRPRSRGDILAVACIGDSEDVFGAQRVLHAEAVCVPACEVRAESWRRAGCNLRAGLGRVRPERADTHEPQGPA